MPPPRRPAGLRGTVFLGRNAVARGLLTPDALRTSAWRRLYRGVYADAELPDGPGLRISGAALLLPPSAVFSGRSAAYLLGAEELVHPRAPVEVTVPPPVRFGPVRGLRIRRSVLAPGDVRRAQGHRCTTALRTTVDLARHEPLLEAVAAVDVLLHRGVVLADEMSDAVRTMPAGREVRQARQVLSLADGRAESPPESRVRVLLTLAGLAPVPQFTVRDRQGGFLARMDLAFPEHRVAIEYDGVWHADTLQFSRDRRRLNRLVEAGWVVLHLTAADLRDPASVVDRVRRLLDSREIGEVGV